MKNELEVDPPVVIFQPSEFRGALRDALAGVTTIFLGGVLISVVLLCAGGLLLGAGALSGTLLSLEPVHKVLAVIAIIIVIGLCYVAWMCCLYVSVTSLQVLGLHLGGKAIYYCLPLAPAIALTCGPLAALASVGRGGRLKNATAVVGVILIAFVALLIHRTLG